MTTVTMMRSLAFICFITGCANVSYTPPQAPALDWPAPPLTLDDATRQTTCMSLCATEVLTCDTGCFSQPQTEYRSCETKCDDAATRCEKECPIL